MTDSNTPAQEQSSPVPETIRESEKEGFFNRVQRALSPTIPVHPTEAAEIVIIEDEGKNEVDFTLIREKRQFKWQVINEKRR